MVIERFALRRLRSVAAAGAAAAVAGTAVAAATLVLSAQQRRHDELHSRLTRMEESSRSTRDINLVNQQRLHWELLSKAMDDPSLAAVLDTYSEEIPPGKQRQFLFANALYTNAFLAYRLGIVDRDELFGHLRGIFQNPVVREYWTATRPHRATLEDASDEAQLGRMVDGLLHDLDEADTDEWWVVGELPPDS
ncbi:DUF6082 family protein [Streptomyces sp. NPDC091292]|uniref:DUF6082 family protein n=1 Tax=Streptomyces sp. NPDC091292 TaxID=3365991 RepID=UPI003804C91F